MIGHSCVYVFDLSLNTDEVHEQGAIQMVFNAWLAYFCLLFFVFCTPLSLCIALRASTSQLHQEGPVTGCASKL